MDDSLDMRCSFDSVSPVKNEEETSSLAEEAEQSDRRNESTEQIIRRLSIEETLVDVDGVPINYVKIGTGKTNLFISPDSLQTWKTEFVGLLGQLDLSKFTVVAWDPPGYGKSRPIDRKFNVISHRKDALTAQKLMKKLGMHPYSVLGYGEGGIVGLHMAATSGPSTLKKLVIWSCWPNVQLITKEYYEKIKDIKTWPVDLRQQLSDVYGGDDELQKLMIRYNNFIKRAYERRTNGNIVRDMLSYIRQPVLLLHGGRGHIPKYYVQSVADDIARSKLVSLENGRLELHKRNVSWFVRQVEEFLLSDWKEMPHFSPKHIDQSLLFR